MAARKAMAGPGIEEERGLPFLEGAKRQKEWPPKHLRQRNDKFRDQGAGLGSASRKRGRKWPLWIAAVGVLGLLAANLNSGGGAAKSLKKKHEWEGVGQDGGSPFDTEGEPWDFEGEKKAVVRFAPFMAGDALFFEGTAHLKPQTVPLSVEKPDDFALDRSGVPKAWAAYVHVETPEETVEEEEGPSEGPVDLEFLSEFAIPGSSPEGGEAASARLQISTADAMKVAREISNRYFGAAPAEEKQPPEAAANRQYRRLVGRLGSGIVTAVTEAGRLPTMKFDARSRNLRSELALLEIGNEVERLKERQSQALKEVEQARCSQKAGEDDAQAEARVEKAIQTYKSLLKCEKQLMMALVQLASRWTDETNKILTNVASIVTSSAMGDIDEISKLEFSVFNLAKMSKKVYSMSDVLQTEARSKNKCRLVEGVAAKRIKDIDALASSIDKLSSEEFLKLVEKQNEGLEKNRAEFRAVLTKKKQEVWLADII
ncbi:hypothetical protein, conserved [Eimeria brunetti]|uniref:Uncharacterized protein n=1 Tax=Eimeria brunetti TaxID=51314 RepID=U6LLY7_9EIME|nr:hypothetical protein, conserved [Eimeria brunetti]